MHPISDSDDNSDVDGEKHSQPNHHRRVHRGSMRQNMWDSKISSTCRHKMLFLCSAPKGGRPKNPPANPPSPQPPRPPKDRPPQECPPQEGLHSPARTPTRPHPPPDRRTAQNFALFFPLPPPFSFSLSRGLLVEFWCCLKRRDPQINVHVWALGLSCGSQAAGTAS